MAFDGTLKFDTALDDSGFKSGLDGLGSLAQKGLNAVKGMAEQVGTAIINIGKNAISSGQSFEKSMSNVIATMGVTKDTIQDGENVYDKLKQAAADAGKTTAFSASQAGDALNFLALAGYSAEQSVDALPAVLDLAAAGGMALADASNLATNAMAALGIEATNENLVNFGDKMAKTASTANTSVAQLGEAILTVGGTANQLAGGVTELDGLIGVLANRGIFASEAGTHVRNVITTLLKSKDKLKDLGITVTEIGEDGAEHLRPLNEIFSEMSDFDFTDLSEIFHLTDLTAVQGLIAGCGEEFDNLTNAIDNSDGAMSDMAETMLDNLEGDKKILESATEGFYNVIYDGMNGGLRELVQLATSYMTQFTDAFENGGFEGLAQSLGNVVGDAVAKIGGYLPKIVKIGTSFTKSLLEGITKNSRNIAQSGISIALELVKGIGRTLSELPDFATGIVQAIADGLADNQDKITVTLKVVLEMLARSLTENIQPFTEAVISVVGTIGEILLANLPVLISAGVQMLQALVSALLNGENLELLVNAGLMILETVAGALHDNLPALVAVAVQIVRFLADGLKNELPVLREWAVELIGKIGTYFKEHYNEIFDCGVKIVKKIASGLKDTAVVLLGETVLLIEGIGKEFEEFGWLTIGADIVGKILDGIKSMYDRAVEYTTDLIGQIVDTIVNTDWEKLGKDILDGILSGLLGFDADFYDYLDYFKGDFLDGIKEKFKIGSPSKVMRDEVGKYIAEGIGVGFADNIPDVGEDAMNAFRMQSADLWGGFSASPTSNVVNNYYNTANYRNEQPANSTSGDIIIPVSVGGEQIETVVVSAVQMANLRSGGAFT